MLTDIIGPAVNGVAAAIVEATSSTFASVRLRHERQ
jgi:hypothetical protein